MPEGSEIKIMADHLSASISNKTLLFIEVLSGRYRTHPSTWFCNHFSSLTVNSINCHGKFLYWELSDDNYLLATMGMSARWTHTPALSHNRIKFFFKDCDSLYYNDIRNFGTVSLLKGREKLDKKLSNLGLDPLQGQLTSSSLDLALKSKKNKEIGTILLDQSVISGSGNYIRAEALYQARINPSRLTSSLTSPEIKLLSESICDVMQRSYAAGGATIQTYKDMYGQIGTFSEQFQVYKKKVDKNNNPIQRDVDKTGRAIWWCPSIQK
jgi:formamidopyrimidine-DNA glycosylase